MRTNTMGNWKDSNLSAILECPFDFAQYIERQLRRIDDLDERKFAKELLMDGLGSSIRSIEEQYRQLERRVYEELEIAGEVQGGRLFFSYAEPKPTGPR